MILLFSYSISGSFKFIQSEFPLNFNFLSSAKALNISFPHLRAGSTFNLRLLPPCPASRHAKHFIDNRLTFNPEHWPPVHTSAQVNPHATNLVVCSVNHKISVS